MGLVLVSFGVTIAAYMFFRIGQVVLDPRSFETQVDRWEFVIRGRTSDAFPGAYETPDLGLVTTQPGEEIPAVSGNGGSREDRVEEVARLVGRVGSKSARPMALLLIVLILVLMVRIVIGIIHAGIRLAGLSGGEREYMKRIIAELTHNRNRNDD